jgi:hypothetical protein
MTATVSRGSHIVILWLNIERKECHKTYALHNENSCQHGQCNIEHNYRSKMHVYECTSNVIF